MPNKKISQLNSVDQLFGDEKLLIAQSGTNKTSTVPVLGTKLNSDVGAAVSGLNSQNIGFSGNARASITGIGSDLTAGIGALHRSPNAVTSMFVYDTSKDSDGGAWTEKCQHTSWYNETVYGKWLGAQDSETKARYSNASFGPELVSNGTFDSGISGWTAYGIPASDMSWGGGVLKITPSTYGWNRGAYTAVDVEPGSVLKISFNINISGGSWGSIEFNIGSGPDNYTYVRGFTSGNYFVVPSGVTKIWLNQTTFLQSGSAGNYLTLDNVSVRKVTATNTTSGDYFQLTTDGRFYKFNRNILKYSEQFNNSTYWSTNNLNGSISADSSNTTDPIGKNTSDKLTPNTSSTRHNLSQAVSTLLSTYNSYSVYAKAGGYSFLALGAMYGGASSGLLYTFDLTTGVYSQRAVDSNVSNVSASAVDVGNGWWRCSITWKNTIYNPIDTISIAASPAVDTTYDAVWKTVSYTGDGSSGVYIWGAQLEYGSTATTYEAKTADGTTSEVFRGNKREFPKLSAIVAEASNVTIYDLTEPGRPMWMRFNGTSNNSMLRTSAGSVAAFNGEVSVGSTGGWGLGRFNFIKDTSPRHLTIAYRFVGNIAARNATTGYVADASVGTIANATVNAVAMTVLPDAPVDPVTGLQVPTIAVGTAGGVSVIKHDGVVANSTRTYGIYADGLSVANGYLLIGEGSNYSNPNVIKMSAITGTSFTPTLMAPNAGPEISSFTQRLTSVGKNSFVTPGAGLALPLRMFRGNFASTTKSVTARISNTYNTGHLIGDIRRTYLADADAGSVSGTELITGDSSNFAGGTVGSWTVNSSFPGATLDASSGTLVFTPTQNYGGVQLVIPTVAGKTYFLSTTLSKPTGSGLLRINNGNSYSGTIITGTSDGGIATTPTKYEFVFVALSSQTCISVLGNTSGASTVDDVTCKEAASDRSYKARAAVINGTLTKSPVATNAQLVGYSGFSAANYLREPYSADLDFGTGEWSASAWVNIPTTIPETSFGYASEITADGSFDFGIEAGWVPASSNTITWDSTNKFGIFNYINSRQWKYTFSSVQNKLYKVSFTFAGFIGSATWARFGPNADGSGGPAFYGTLVAGTTYTGYITASSASTTLTLAVGDNTSIILSDISIKEVISPISTVLARSHSAGASVTCGVNYLGNLVATAYDGTTTRTVTSPNAYNTGTWNKVRVNYTTDGKLALLVNGVEVASATGTALLTLNSKYNLLNYSQDLAQASAWSTQIAVTVTGNAGTDPIGGNTATSLIFGGQFANRRQGITTVAGQKYTFSVWIKRISGNTAISLFTENAVEGVFTNINITDSWVRYSTTFTATSSVNVGIQDRNTSGFGEVLIWGAQLETGTTAKTYQRVGAATDFDFQAPLTIGNNYAANAPFPGSLALVKFSATVPTTEQSQWMYEQEKAMFQPGAQVCLPSSNSVTDLTYDDLTDTWIAAQSTHISEWKGLVRTSYRKPASGSFDKLSAASGVRLMTRSSWGVDIEAQPVQLKKELFSSTDASINNQNTTTFDFDAVTSQTDFVLPVGYTAQAVFSAGVQMFEGATGNKFTRLFDGFKETIRFATAPGNGVWVKIRAVRAQG